PGMRPATLDRITQPVLILWGDADGILPHASVEFFRSHLRRGTVEVLPGCGHLPHVEQRAIVAARISRFLAELWWSRSRRAAGCASGASSALARTETQARRSAGRTRSRRKHRSFAPDARWAATCS